MQETGVSTMPCCSAYNTRMVVETHNSEQNWIRLKDKRVHLDMLSIVRDLKMREHMSCSVFQSDTWYKTMVPEIENVFDSTLEQNALMGDEVTIQKRAVLTVDAAFATKETLGYAIVTCQWSFNDKYLL